MKRFISLIAILLIGLLVACNQENQTDEDGKEKVIPVETVEAKTGDLVIEKKFYGRTAPGTTSPIMATNPGEIDVIEVENGDHVKEDDLIAKVKSPAGTQSIYAPKEGEIANLEVAEGEMASDSEPLALIIDLEDLNVEFTITSELESLFKKEDQFKAKIADQEHEVEITSISRMPDDTGLYPIEATIKNDDDEIFPGMITTITVPEKRIEDSILLPTEAIVEEADGDFIYLIKDDQAIKTEIEIKESQTDQTAIEGEIEKGDQVVINGQLTLSDGSKVDVMKEGNNS